MPAQTNLSILEMEKSLRHIGLKSNPFSPEPLGEENISLFVGREKEIEKALRAIAEKKNVIISGWKGMGKTSLLNFLKAKAKSENIMVTSLIGTPDERPFFLNMLAGLFRENILDGGDQKVLATIKRNMREYWKSPAGYPTDLIINDTLEIVNYYRQTNFPLIVFVDEIHRLAIPRAKYNLQTTLCDFMFKPNFIFVCAGMTSFFKMMDEPDAALADRFTPSGDIILKPFALEETEELIKKRLNVARDNPREDTSPFSLDAVKTVHRYSEGNPRHIVNLCYEALRLHATKKKEKITKNDIEEQAATLKILFSQRSLAQLGEETQLIFKALVDLGAGSPTSLGRMLGKLPTTIQYHLNILRQAGLVLAKGTPPRTKYYPTEPQE